MLTKSYEATFKAAKAADGTPTGEVEAVVSCFGNVDLMGDRVVKGAFAKTLEEWKAAGDPIPLVWSHDWANPMSHIGSWDPASAVETDKGLLLKGRIDVGKGNPVADQVARLLADRRVREFSFAYDIRDEKTAADGANELLDLGLIEAGPTLKGANPETELVMAKAQALAEAKAGRVLSAKNEQAIRDAVAGLQGVLSSMESAPKGAKAPAETPAEEDVEEEAEASAFATLAGLLNAAAEIVQGLVADEAEDVAPDAGAAMMAAAEDEAYAEKARREEASLKDALLRLSLDV